MTICGRGGDLSLGLECIASRLQSGLEGREANGAGVWQVGRSYALHRLDYGVADDDIERRHEVLEDRVAMIGIGGTDLPVPARNLFGQAFHLSNVARQWRRSSREPTRKISIELSSNASDEALRAGLHELEGCLVAGVRHWSVRAFGCLQHGPSPEQMAEIAPPILSAAASTSRSAT